MRKKDSTGGRVGLRAWDVSAEMGVRHTRVANGVVVEWQRECCDMGTQGLHNVGDE